MAEPQDASGAVNATCPRCGQGFHCGVLESSCACTTLQLDEATRAALDRSFHGCLCLTCLYAVQEECRLRP